MVAMHAPSTVPPSLTPREAAVQLGVDPVTVRRWLTEGALVGVRVGGRYRIDPADLAAFVEPAARAEPAAMTTLMLRRRRRR